MPEVPGRSRLHGRRRLRERDLSRSAVSSEELRERRQGCRRDRRRLRRLRVPTVRHGARLQRCERLRSGRVHGEHLPVADLQRRSAERHRDGHRLQRLLPDEVRNRQGLRQDVGLRGRGLRRRQLSSALCERGPERLPDGLSGGAPGRRQPLLQTRRLLRLRRSRDGVHPLIRRARRCRGGLPLGRVRTTTSASAGPGPGGATVRDGSDSSWERRSRPPEPSVGLLQSRRASHPIA